MATETKTYTGGCHCGKVRYRASIALESVMACNCSICSRKGSLLTFIPAEQFELLSGEADLAEYKFNKHVISHLFCKTCGIHSFARGQRPDGTKMAAINARCLDDVDVSALTITHFDGKSR
jgi:hypothetical protein